MSQHRTYETMIRFNPRVWGGGDFHLRHDHIYIHIHTNHRKAWRAVYRRFDIEKGTTWKKGSGSGPASLGVSPITFAIEPACQMCFFFFFLDVVVQTRRRTSRLV